MDHLFKQFAHERAGGWGGVNTEAPGDTLPGLCGWALGLKGQHLQRARLEGPGKNASDLCPKRTSLKPLIKNTLAASLRGPWKLRAQWLFSPTVPDTIWRQVKRFNNCVSCPETGELMLTSR